MESMPINRDISSRGALVNVDEEIRPGERSSGEGVAYVHAVNDENRTVDVRYPGSNIFSPGVAEHRLHPYSLAEFDAGTDRRLTRTRRRRLSFDEAPPAPAPAPALATSENSRSRSPTTVIGTIEASRGWCKTDRNPLGPICKFLNDGRQNKQKGWLRERYAKETKRPAPKSNNNFCTPEKKVITEMYSRTKHVSASKRPPNSHPLSDLAYAFDKTKESIIRVDKRYTSRDLNHDRKKRADAGVSAWPS